jgi:hypothetical protein
VRSDPPEGAAHDGAPDRARPTAASPTPQGRPTPPARPVRGRPAPGAHPPRGRWTSRRRSACSPCRSTARRPRRRGAGTRRARTRAGARADPGAPCGRGGRARLGRRPRAVDPDAVRARLAGTLDRVEALLDRDGGPGFLFDDDRATPDDQAIRVRAERDDDARPLWFVGDLHGDLLALEAALALARAPSGGGADAGDGGDTPAAAPRLVFLGDLFDDGGYGLEVLARVFELLADDPGSACVLAGNHDEALAWTGERFASRVSPSDFADYLNAHLGDDGRRARRAPRGAAVRRAPRALFSPTGCSRARRLPARRPARRARARGDFNDPRALTDFAWVRLHPKARRKLPNRASRGSQFGREDFDDFCALARRLGARSPTSIAATTTSRSAGRCRPPTPRTRC